MVESCEAADKHSHGGESLTQNYSLLSFAQNSPSEKKIMTPQGYLIYFCSYQ